MRRPWMTLAYGAALRLPHEARDAMVADARVLSAATIHRIYDEILSFRLPAVGAADRILAVAADAVSFW